MFSNWPSHLQDVRVFFVARFRTGMVAALSGIGGIGFGGRVMIVEERNHWFLYIPAPSTMGSRLRKWKMVV